MNRKDTRRCSSDTNDPEILVLYLGAISLQFLRDLTLTRLPREYQRVAVEQMNNPTTWDEFKKRVIDLYEARCFS